MRAILQLHGEVRSSFATLKIVPPNKVAFASCGAFKIRSYRKIRVLSYAAMNLIMYYY